MLNLIAAFNALVFLALAGLHGYWAVGGTTGLAAALPAHPAGAVVFRPGRGMVWAVAGGLLMLAALSAVHLAPGRLGLPTAGLRVADWAMAALFLLRAVGDFKFVGFTKRVRATTFARLDTRYYSPLCLLLAVGSAALALAI